MHPQTQSSAPATKKKLKIRLHWVIAILLLLIPLSVGVYVSWPQYYGFTALGEIVSVQEIGVKGSVHFVYVREGVARNRIEKLSISRSMPDAEFYPADSSARDALDEMKDVGEESRNETIRHAVDSAAELTEAPTTKEERDTRRDQLIEETSRYYGDSIGLMLGIGLVEETEHEDFSRNGARTIAGTGTLEADESVGSVGAIRDKLRTAEKFGADIFFVPKDKETYPYIGLSNEEEAAQVAQELGLHLRVVPVANLGEAIAFLRQAE
ncbi:hypothetical protein GE107_23165 [Cohnella sp. CFH 77786]|uniref:hypothetical protein n=1 Tax=Cohnella sp. CFH 77786 TaxID=2662265 RepID=UPI001C608FEF|nr:hypothetical protein [Cohnella sp. CFH 77786]MBW5448944.1 hypothetical protein [Cohnella sp. CFH 77786]